MKLTFINKKIIKGIKIKKTAIFTLLLLSMTVMMSNVAIVTSLPRFQEYFSHIKNIEFYSRLMLTLPSLTIGILAPFLGHFVFRFGKKSSAIIALAIFALTGSAGLFLEKIEYFLISRALFGIAIATLMIVSTSLIGDYFKDKARYKFMAYQSSFMAVGGVLFVLGGGFLSDINWRLPFGIYLIGFLLLPMAIYFLYEVPKDSILNEEETIISTKLFVVYFFAFFYMLIFFILPTQIPFLLIDHFHASGKVAGSIISLAFLANALGAISFSKLKVRFTYSSIYLIGLFVISFGFLSISLVNNIFLFYFTAPILGFGGGIMMTNITAWMLSRSSNKRRVKSSGYLTSALFLGQFFSPILFHPLVNYFGVQKFFFVIAISLLLIVLSSFLLYKNKKI